MKRFAKFLFFAVSISATTMASCNNMSAGGVGSNAKADLAGKWKVVKISTDPADNAAPSQPDDNNIVITFNEDGTGSSSSSSGGSAFKWEITNKDCLRITDSSTSVVNALFITKISGSSFTVRDTSAHPVQWETYKKQ